MSQSNQLFSEFNPVSKEEWIAKIEQDLKGKAITDFNMEMGGVEVSAFFHTDDLQKKPIPISRNSSWEIGEDIAFNGESKATNKNLLFALANGINAPRIVMNRQPTNVEIENIFNDVNLEMISSHFYLERKEINPNHIVTDFIELAGKKGVELSALKGSINGNNKSISTEILGLVVRNKMPFKLVTENGLEHFSETNISHELGEIIGSAEGLIQQFLNQGHSVNEINNHLQFSIGIGKNFFLQIAKIRALKLLWGNILKAYAVDNPEIPSIEAHIPKSTFKENPNSNMISATPQAMSAIIGGVSRLTILPSDTNSDQNSYSFSKRIARNVQHILQQESYFDRVGDPGAGSYFIEKLTIKIAKKTWEQFAKGNNS